MSLYRPKAVSPRQWPHANNLAQCDLCGELQSKLSIVKEHYEHYLALLTSIIVIYRLVYQLLSLSYCYTFVCCLMKCVPKYDLD
jgi:hypothetical protein